MSQVVLNQRTYNSTSTAYENSRVASSAPARLCGITIYNSSGSTQFIQFHDAASLPANGAVPKFYIEIPTASSRMIEYLRPRSFDVGIVVCNSSTATTKTIGSADCWFDIQTEKVS